MSHKMHFSTPMCGLLTTDTPSLQPVRTGPQTKDAACEKEAVRKRERKRSCVSLVHLLGMFHPQTEIGLQYFKNWGAHMQIIFSLTSLQQCTAVTDKFIFIIRKVQPYLLNLR
jgi:hypothetical protein